MTRLQAMVFDMDGVLIDSEEWHAHALLRTPGSRCSLDWRMLTVHQF